MAINREFFLLIIFISIVLVYEFSRPYLLVEHDIECKNNNKDRNEEKHLETKLSHEGCRNKPLNWDRFKQTILRSSEIYSSIDKSSAKLDVEGYGDITKLFDGLFTKILSAKRAKNDNAIRIIEVGSFKGNSTSSIGKKCKEAIETYGITCDVIATDTWLGSPWHYEVDVKRFLDGLQYLNLYNTFLTNMFLLNLDTIVHTLRLPSTAAAHVLHCYKIDADIIYIDAGHDYEDVIRDIRLYYPLLKKGGIIFGDDYSTNWNGVIEAVKEFTQFNGLSHTVKDGRTWIIEDKKEDSKFFS